MPRKRKPMGYWSYWSNTKVGLKHAIRRIGHFPTSDELREHGLSSLAKAIINHGGFPKARERMGYRLSRLPNGYYDDFEVLRRDLESFIRLNNEEFPTYPRLEELGRSDLIRGVGKHGGLGSVRKKLGLGPGIKPRGYWESPLNIRIEAKQVMERHGLSELPGKGTLAEMGYSSLAAAVVGHYPGKYRALRRDLVQTDLNKPYGYWDKPGNVEKETRAVMRQFTLTRVPSRNFLKQIGRCDLDGGINRYPGGYRGLRRNFQEAQMRREDGHWQNWRNVRKEVKKIIDEYGELPGKQDVSRLNSSLAAAITRYHGGFRKVREKMRQKQKKTEDGIWDDPKNIEKAIKKFKRKEKFNHLPQYRTLASLGYAYLAAAITSHYPGGFEGYRRDHDDYTPGQRQTSGKTPQMVSIEKRIREPIEVYLRREYQERGSYTIAQDLEVSDTTVLKWLRHFRIMKEAA